MKPETVIDRVIEAVVLGGSAGALNGLKRLMPSVLGDGWPPTLVVVHLREGGGPAGIAQVLSRMTGATVKEAEDKEPIVRGTVYVAPAGYHMLVADDRSIALSIDAPVHFSRPAIDALFESAADVFGENLLALLLSGASRDGANGLRHVQTCGGIAIVQSPEEAAHAAMPLAAIETAKPDHVLELSQLVQLFAAVAEQAKGGISRWLA
jgi:two-component system chemotaxis response regulator CheB